MPAHIRTFTGKLIDLAAPEVKDISILDISRGLSHLCRFAGQLPRFYSVAQHSVLVSQLVDPEVKCYGLLHDASEAYMGDLSRNLKHHTLLQGYCLIEGLMQAVILTAFGLRVAQKDSSLYLHLKAADDLAAIFEKVQLRQQTRWRGASEIYDAIDSGYASSSEESMGRLLDRLPRFEYVSWDSRTADRKFMETYHKEFVWFKERLMRDEYVQSGE